MAKSELLRKRVEHTPFIYAYELIGVPSHDGMLKVGYTVRDPDKRVEELYPYVRMCLHSVLNVL